MNSICKLRRVTIRIAARFWLHEPATRATFRLATVPSSDGTELLIERSVDGFGITRLAQIPGIALERFAVKLREKTRDRRAWKLAAKLSVLCEQGFATNANEVLAVADELRAVGESADWKAAGGVQDIRPVHEYGDAKIQRVLDGLLYEGTVNVLTGDAGTGKSTLALAIAAAVASGSVFAGRITSRRPVLIVDRENTLPITIERLNRLGIRDGNGLLIWGGWCPTEPAGT